MIYPLLEGALVMGHALGAAAEPHLLAEVIPALTTDAALAAGDADLERHAVANREPAARPRTDRHDDPRRLVPERQRRARAQVPVGELRVVRDVGAADARRSQRDLQLAVSRRLDGPGLLWERLNKVITRITPSSSQF